MSISDKLQGEGGYVFVSHSHHDIKKVREIRNMLEEKGFEPILFYLKSLDDPKNDQTEFLRTLIYNEIDAREFFLYLDSENARASEWVRQELEYIEKNAPHKLTTVDLNDEQGNIVNKINTLTSKMRIFVSYSRKDTEIYLKIKEAIINADFRVYDDMSLNVGSDFKKGIKETICEASKEGIIMVLVSKNSLESEYVSYELSCALEIKARVLPVFIDDSYLSIYKYPLLNILGRYHCSLMQNGATPENLKNLVKLLKEIG